jgi:hypothetical protein
MHVAISSDHLRFARHRVVDNYPPASKIVWALEVGDTPADRGPEREAMAILGENEMSPFASYHGMTKASLSRFYLSTRRVTTLLMEPLMELTVL